MQFPKRNGFSTIFVVGHDIRYNFLWAIEFDNAGSSNCGTFIDNDDTKVANAGTADLRKLHGPTGKLCRDVSRCQWLSDK